LPVLCQKPFCESLEQAQAVVEFCQQAGVRLMVNENFRWQAWYREIKTLLTAGALGKPFWATVRWRSRMTLPDFEHVQAYLAEMPRLILYELGVHYLDTLRFLFGEPDTVFARLHRISPHVKGEDVQAITVGYPELTCLINSSWASVLIPDVDRPRGGYQSLPPPRLEIDGTEGTLMLKIDGSLHLFTDSDHQQWQFPPDTRPKAHVAAQQHFVDCLESGATFETSGAETVKTMALVYACYLSAAEGRVVDPKELF
jgi:predicted dehydrogenase